MESVSLKTIFERISDVVCTCFPDIKAEDFVVGAPPSLDLGDVAVPLFSIAKRLRRPPVVIAGELSASAPIGGFIESAAAAGPYVNFKLNRNVVGAEIIGEIIRSGGCWGSNNTGAGKKVLIEHTSINPNASPHVGRGRCAMIGDSITRLLRFEGYDVEVHYYVNDMGRQIGLLVLLADELRQLTFAQILDAYVEANKRAEEEPEFARRGYELLAKIEEGDEETQRKFHAVTALCLKGQLAVLERLGVSYDVFDRESRYVTDSRLDIVERALTEKGALFTDEDGRRVVDLSKLGYEPEEGRYFVLRRANGSSMYGCRDLVYSIDKHERGASLNLMVLGEDHKLYAQQLALMLEAAGIPAPEVVYYAYILLKDGKMSTRQGKVVLLSDFLDQAAALALERVREQFPDIASEEQHAIAEQVAVSAIRFAVLRVRPNKNVTFDMDAALSFQGDTGPYIQYSCARIRSILRKHKEPIPQAPDSSFKVETDAEWMLLMKLAAFPQVVADATAQRVCAGIANYALELAHAFTAFYHECPVLTADDESVRRARIFLCRATLQTLGNALHILGIETPERM
ncbi:MAG TPA: arginine--tRNA ligase [Candidatus Hydrogenedentes bacterium]|nr:arginine--tRNA ligase [Candidatus Hydrogenedentota bacterium]